MAILKELGYHMTEQDVEDLKIKAAGKFHLRKTELAVVNARIEQTAKELEGLAKLLRTSSQIPFPEPPMWLNSGLIKEMLEDRELAKERVREACSSCKELGIVVE